MLPLAIQLNNTSTPILSRADFIIDTGNTLYCIICKQTYLKLGKPKFTTGAKVITANGLVEIPVFKGEIILETLDIDFVIECEIAVSDKINVDIIGSPLLRVLCKKTDTDLVFSYTNSCVSLR